jgi:hypothetical protein
MFSKKIKHNYYRCDAVLKKFLDDLHRNPEKVNYTDMINTVVIYSYSTDEFVQVNTNMILLKYYQFFNIIEY